MRARLEDLIEIEVKRAGKGFTSQSQPMTFSDASRLLNASILAMRILGWAWRWSEWWVEHDSNWEPLLEPGQNEKKMTKEQLKIVESTRESRRDDARRCRLAAFGAALRNRAYDVDDDGFGGGFDHDSLERALRAVLHTKSLVGPLKKIEINFYVEWLGRAYRSRSRLLGFGDDKIEIGSGEFCFNQKNATPKFELGDRSIPGRQELPDGKIYEDLVEEVDDFDVYREHVLKAVAEQKARAKAEPKKKAPKKKKTKRGRPARVSELVVEEEPTPVPAAPEDNEIIEVPLSSRIDRSRKSREPVMQPATNEGVAILDADAKERAGRPRKRPLSPDPDPDCQVQAEEQPKKRQRRQRLSVPLPPANHSKLADPPVIAANGSPSVIYDRIKKRSRTKPQPLSFGVEDNPEKSGNFSKVDSQDNGRKSPRRRHLRGDDTVEEVDFDAMDEDDVPILYLLGLDRKGAADSRVEDGQAVPGDYQRTESGVKEGEGENNPAKDVDTLGTSTKDQASDKAEDNAQANRGEEGTPAVCPEKENVEQQVVNKDADRDMSPPEVATDGENVARNDEDATPKQQKDWKETSEVTPQPQASDETAQQDEIVAEGTRPEEKAASATKEETETAVAMEDDESDDEEEYEECAEDRLISLETFIAPAETAIERGRLIGKHLAIEDFFKTPRSFKGRIEYP